MPSHFFLQGVSFFSEDHYIHLFYFVSFFFFIDFYKKYQNINIVKITVLNFGHLPYKNLGVSECDLRFGPKVIVREKSIFSLIWSETTEKIETLDKKLYVLTFFQICADVFGFVSFFLYSKFLFFISGFTIFTFPLSFQLYFLNYQKGIGFMLFWMITAWQSDNGALFFGSLLGTHKFVPAVSPKKTLEGVFGAIFLRYFSLSFIFFTFR